MQRYVKYCKKEHNIAEGCETIQLGTLYHYRDMDPNFSIADHNEGNETIVINDYDSKRTTPYTSAPLSQLIEFDDTASFKMQNSLMILNCPNCFVFCVSQDPEGDYDSEAKRFDKNSYYIIHGIDFFAQKLRGIIMNRFSIEWFDKESISFVRKQTGLYYEQSIKLYCIHGPVIYESKSTIIDSSKIISPAPTIKDPFLRVLFTKDKTYEDEKEYRLVFAFTHNGELLSVNNDPIIIPSDALIHSK